MASPAHPKKEVEQALSYAEGQGWRVEVGGSQEGLAYGIYLYVEV